MQNKNWIWIALVLVALILLAVLLSGQGGLGALGKTSLRSLLAADMAQKCSFANSDSTGTLYVGGGQMRGDFASKTAEGAAQSHMVIANNIVYIWADGSSQGYRMPFSDLKEGNSTGGIDADARVASDCTPWQTNPASFSLPADVSFAALPAKQ